MSQKYYRIDKGSEILKPLKLHSGVRLQNLHQNRIRTLVV